MHPSYDVPAWSRHEIGKTALELAVVEGQQPVEQAPCELGRKVPEPRSAEVGEQVQVQSWAV